MTKIKNSSIKIRKSGKKSKILGIKNYKLDMLGTVFWTQEHGAIG